MDKIRLIQKLDETAENFRKDMFLFSQDSNKPVTESDLHKLATMNYYAISDIVEVVKKLID